MECAGSLLAFPYLSTEQHPGGLGLVTLPHGTPSLSLFTVAEDQPYFPVSSHIARLRFVGVAQCGARQMGARRLVLPSVLAKSQQR